MKNTDAPRVANAHESPPTQGVGSGSSGSTLSFDEFWRDPAPSPAPRTDAAFAKYINDASPIPFRDFARQLEIENGDLRKRVTLAEAAVVAAHSAMLGKVNPKHPAWGCIYAVQDAANRANYEPMSRSGGVVHESNVTDEPRPCLAPKAAPQPTCQAGSLALATGWALWFQLL